MFFALDDGECLSLMGHIVGGRYRAVHLATECTTWILARFPPLGSFRAVHRSPRHRSSESP